MTRRRPKSRGGNYARVSLPAYLRAILGKPCWGVEYSRQLNLSMSFGQPALRIREPFKTTSASQVVQRAAARRQIVVKGRWWLWLFLAQWRLTLRGEEEVRWTSRQRAKAEALRQLDGQKLMAVEVDSADGRTRFSFDLGAELEVWRLTRECVEDRLWSLYLPDGYVIAVRGDGAILRVAGSESGL